MWSSGSMVVDDGCCVCLEAPALPPRVHTQAAATASLLAITANTTCTAHAPNCCPPLSGDPFNPLQVALNVSGPGMSHTPLGGEAFDAATANVTRWVVAEALKAATGEGPGPLHLFRRGVLSAAAQPHNTYSECPCVVQSANVAAVKILYGYQVCARTTCTFVWSLPPTPTLSLPSCPSHPVLPHSQGKE